MTLEKQREINQLFITLEDLKEIKRLYYTAHWTRNDLAKKYKCCNQTMRKYIAMDLEDEEPDFSEILATQEKSKRLLDRLPKGEHTFYVIWLEDRQEIKVGETANFSQRMTQLRRDYGEIRYVFRWQTTKKTACDMEDLTRVYLRSQLNWIPNDRFTISDLSLLKQIKIAINWRSRIPIEVF